MPNTYLDARSNYPGQTGPTRDWTAIAATEPVYRQEPWQIQAQRMPVTMTMKSTRPRTYTKSDPAIPLQRLPVSVRSSNQSPVQAGLGPQNSTWRLSDPSLHQAEQNALAGLPSGSMPGMGIQGLNGANCGMGTFSLTGASLPVLALVGAAIGVLVYKCRKKK